MALAGQLSTIETAVRSAVSTGAYEEATLLLSRYSKQLGTELQNGTFQGYQLSDEIARTNNLLDWIFRMVSAAKSHDTAQLSELRSASSYRRALADEVHSWRLEG